MASAYEEDYFIRSKSRYGVLRNFVSENVKKTIENFLIIALF